MKMTEQFTPQEIRDLRKSMDCSQEEFCKIMAITVATLSRWETGKVVPHGKNHELLSFLKGKIDKGPAYWRGTCLQRCLACCPYGKRSSIEGVHRIIY